MADDVIITREDGETKGRYVAKLPGLPAAELTFSRAGATRLILDHTEVPDALRGTGVGRALLERAVSDARAADTKLIPLCPFAKAQFERHPEWRDIRG